VRATVVVEYLKSQYLFLDFMLRKPSVLLFLNPFNREFPLHPAQVFVGLQRCVAFCAHYLTSLTCVGTYQAPGAHAYVAAKPGILGSSAPFTFTVLPKSPGNPPAHSQSKARFSLSTASAMQPSPSDASEEPFGAAKAETDPSEAPLGP
jgi:hypothetical protein